MERETKDRLLKAVLIRITILNIKNSIAILKEMFITPCNKQYLESWFNFFEIDFFKKDLETQKREYQWMQNILIKYKDIVFSFKSKETEFLAFKVEKETFFPWDKQIDFDLLKFTLKYEEQQQQAKNQLVKQIEGIRRELYLKLSNVKLELREKLYKNSQKQDDIVNFHNDSLCKLAIWQEQKTNKYFKLKSKIIIFFTLGYYNCVAKLINRIDCEKVVLQNQKEQLVKIGLKICNIKKSLDKIEKKIRKKRQRLACFQEKFSFVSSKVNSINIHNNKDPLTNIRLIRQL